MVPVAVDCVSWRLAISSAEIAARGRNTAPESSAESAGLGSVPAGIRSLVALELLEPRAAIVTSKKAKLPANRANEVEDRLSMHRPEVRSQ